ncbi:MAG: flagellar basal body rod protein FlgC [Deltaproteobacteria bacterium]|nr:flagellar basal body rod protein FlgC [Deltaproteobacteria bacterium]
MDFFKAMQISGSGLSVERTRVNLATSNLANAESTRGPDGQPYKRLDPVLRSNFDNALAAEGTASVTVEKIVADPSPGKRVYSPGHPDADGDGFVTLPNVNPIHEVVNLMSASRGYEANATAMDTLKTMATRALEIGK